MLRNGLIYISHLRLIGVLKGEYRDVFVDRTFALTIPPRNRSLGGYVVIIPLGHLAKEAQKKYVANVHPA